MEAERVENWPHSAPFFPRARNKNFEPGITPLTINGEMMKLDDTETFKANFFAPAPVKLRSMQFYQNPFSIPVSPALTNEIVSASTSKFNSRTQSRISHQSHIDETEEDDEDMSVEEMKEIEITTDQKDFTTIDTKSVNDWISPNSVIAPDIWKSSDDSDILVSEFNKSANSYRNSVSLNDLTPEILAPLSKKIGNLTEKRSRTKSYDSNFQSNHDLRSKLVTFEEKVENQDNFSENKIHPVKYKSRRFKLGLRISTKQKSHRIFRQKMGRFIDSRLERQLTSESNLSKDSYCADAPATSDKISNEVINVTQTMMDLNCNIDANDSSIPETPKEFYVRRRRSTVTSIGSNIIAEEEMSFIPQKLTDESATKQQMQNDSSHSNSDFRTLQNNTNIEDRDILGSEISLNSTESLISSEKLDNRRVSLNVADGPKSYGLPETARSAMVTPRIGISGVENRLFTEDGMSLYEYVHDVERRQSVFLESELSRYATFNDPGPGFEMPEASEMEEEIKKLTGLLSLSTVPIPAYLRRRGILYARVQKYPEALIDFSKSIQYDPFNSDAYWNRHQLYLLQGNVELALKDLDAITESNRQHFGAFLAKSRIYQEIGAIKLAIVNYSQVVKLKPEHPDGYYQRACLFEAENEMVYANEDFKMVRILDPTNEHAIKNLAMYSFERELWNDAIQAFTKLIRIHPEDGVPYSFRGRALAFLTKWEDALQDLTAAIQLDPEKSEFFFYRGCLLRDRNIRKAIEDFS
ncbi:cytochrome c oxidase subunit 1, partial [Nowakowskiella sp. JEL0078]